MEEIVLLAQLQAEEGNQDQFVEEFVKLCEECRKEPGCLLYALHRDASKPNSFYLLEKWSSHEAFNKHLETEHFRTRIDTISTLAVGKPKIVSLEAVVSTTSAADVTDIKKKIKHKSPSKKKHKTKRMPCCEESSNESTDETLASEEEPALE